MIEIIDKVFFKVIDEGCVEPIIHHRCTKLDWFSESILENFVEMLKKEIKKEGDLELQQDHVRGVVKGL